LISKKNCLAIDYGTKNIGLAISTLGVISPLLVLENNPDIYKNIISVIYEYQISKVYVGMSKGKFALKTKHFVDKLSTMIKCSIETVEETVSTIEATQIYLNNNGKKKNYKQKIDAISAAVILERALA